MQPSAVATVTPLGKRGRSSQDGFEDELLKSAFLEEEGPRRTASDTLPCAGVANAGPFARASLPQAPEPACPSEPAQPSLSRHASRPSSPVLTTEAGQLPLRSGSQEGGSPRASVDATAKSMDELMTAGAELHMAKRARYSRDQAQQLRGRSRSQLMDLARDLEAQEQRLREELREARRSYVRRVSDLARRTENTVRGSAEALPHRQGACMLAATETAARSGETMARAALHQPSASFSFPRLQPGSTTAAAATTVTTACSTLGGAGLIMGAPHAARRSSGDGPAVVMGPPASVPPSRRCSGGGVPSGPMLAPRRDTEQSQPQQPQAWRQSAPALPAAAAQAPLTRDGVLSSVMAMLRSKAAATAAAPTPDAAPPPSKGQPVFPPHPTELRMARALSAKRSPAMPPPSSSSSPSQGWLSHKPAPTPLTSSPPVPLSLLLPLPQQALPQQLPAARASARFAIDQQHQHPRPMAQPQLQLAPSPRRAPVLQLVGGF